MTLRPLVSTLSTTLLLAACAAAGSDDDGGTAGTGDDPTPGSASDPSAADTADDSDGSDDADTTDTADTADTNDTTDTDDPPSCEATHHSSEAQLWTLPAAVGNVESEPFTRIGGANVCAADGVVDFYYSAFDLTGDGRLDLVVTSACDAGDVGTDFWLVYEGGDDGFAADATLWSLPTPTADVEGEPFVQLGGAKVCSADGVVDFYYAVTDLTADGRPDLVVTSACDSGDVGSDFWLVYAGGDGGFADDASLWSLPAPTADVEGEAFVQLGGAKVCSADGVVDFDYAVTDLDGDGVVDLVVTSACDTGDVGTDFWLVHRGGDDGFADDASLWTLPTPTANLEGEPFSRLGGANVCSADGVVDFEYAVTDLGGDGLVDLVVTSACDAGDVGTDFWLVYPNEGDGFGGDASLWSLPTPTANVEGEPFGRIGGANVCSADGIVDFQYTSTDLTADGIPDLVVTAACDAGDVGTDFWLVHAGGGDGFADEAALWGLPSPTADLEGEPFSQVGGANVCAADGVVDFEYASVDLTADRIVDLVVTSACDTGDVGTEFWLVYPGACE